MYKDADDNTLEHWFIGVGIVLALGLGSLLVIVSSLRG